MPLLGVNGVCIVAHGRSTPYAIQNAIRICKEAVEGGTLDAIRSLRPAVKATTGIE